MRDLVLFLGMLFYMPVSLVAPAAGLLCWEWISIMAPQSLVYGFAHTMHFDFVIAILTLVGWLISRERKRFTPDALPWLMLAFFAWSTFNMLFVPYPSWSWPYWYRVLKAFVPVFLAFILMTRKSRIQGLIWVIAVSLGFYGIKGGMYTIVHHGNGRVFGPPGNQLSDNNNLALALVMGIPLVYYLLRNTSKAFLRVGLGGVIVLQMLAVFGSYSRGAAISLGVVLTMFWLRSKNKVFYAAVGSVVVIAAVSVMPAAFWVRMHTLSDVSASGSFEGRVRSWHVAFDYARDHFPFGAGFYAPQLGVIYHRYFPDAKPRAAHSIYFQVLGEGGFPALVLYLLILLLALRNTQIVIRQTRNKPELAWAHDLASMLQVSLIGFYTGGAALSLAYFDGFLILMALTSCLREMTAPSRVTQAAAQPGISSIRSRAGVAEADSPGRPPPWPAPIAGRTVYTNRRLPG